MGNEKKLTSFQALSLLEGIKSLDSFERMDCVCDFYNRLLYKDTFQIILRSLPDVSERDNVRIRLNFPAQKSDGIIVGGYVVNVCDTPGNSASPEQLHKEPNKDSLENDEMNMSVPWTML